MLVFCEQDDHWSERDHSELQKVDKKEREHYLSPKSSPVPCTDP